MPDALLVLNSGSSSLKFSAFQAADLRLLMHGQVEGIGTAPRYALYDSSGQSIEQHGCPDSEEFDHAAALKLVLDRCRVLLNHDHLVGVGHRVVHGGITFASPVRVDRAVVDELERLIPLAPLHQPHNLGAMRMLLQQEPHLPQVACFDTAFHRSQPDVAQRFGLPRRYTEEGVRRYGFHGLSYEYIASVLPEIDPRAARGRTIVAHLGNGASLCAMRSGRSVATTMSFTPVDGLVMGTRVGALDPGVVLYLMAQYGLNADDLQHVFYHESGLLGVSGVSSDMRALLSSSDSHAAEAIDLFIYRIGREIGSLAAALGGLDALVFTGGIGEHAASIRACVCRDAAWLGLELSEVANEQALPCISEASSEVAAWVIPTNEELLIAQHTRRLLNSDAGHGNVDSTADR